MGVFDKIKNVFGVEDEDFEDEFEYYEEEEVVENTVKPDFTQNVQPKKEKTVPMQTVSSQAVSSAPLQVVLVKPEKFDDASSIADSLNAKKTVVLNLEATSKEVSRRLVDFLSGVAYANNGQLKKIANSTFIITPYNVDVSGIGILEEIDMKEKYLMVNYSGVYVFYAFDDLADLSLAYAMSVHKSQGSEYQIVYFIFNRNNIHMLNKKLIYTAISRARKKLVIIGDETLFRQGLSRSMKQRATTLKERLGK